MKINCRARLDDVDCDNGKPDDPKAPASEDGTFDPTDRSIVCDLCYVRLMWWTASGRGLNEELPKAIEIYRQALGELRELGDEDVQEAVNLGEQLVGSGLGEWVEGPTSMAKREIERRSGKDDV